MNRKTLVFGALVLALVAVPVAVLAAGQSDLAEIRRATAKYHDLQVALDEGFVPLAFETPPERCISHATEGAMGVHYILGSRFDAELSVDQPEALIYDFESDDEPRLVAVEYVVPAAAWTQADPPEFLGQTLQYKTTVGPHGADEGVTPYYELHVWTWLRNPSGVFADWNPRVTCP